MGAFDRLFGRRSASSGTSATGVVAGDGQPSTDPLPEASPPQGVASQNQVTDNGQQSVHPSPEASPARGIAGEKWIANEGNTVFAFKALTPEAAAMGAFRNVVWLTSGPSEADQIRQMARCPDAHIVLLEPGEWNAPEVRGLSAKDIADPFPLVCQRACETLSGRFGITDYISTSLPMAGAMPHPRGFVLYLFTIPGHPGPDD